MINAVEYVCFRDLIFMITTSFDIIIDCLFFFDLVDDCKCESFSILESKIDISWFWSEFKISFIFKSIWRRNIASIIFSLNFWSLFEIISKIKRWVFFVSVWRKSAFSTWLINSSNRDSIALTFKQSIDRLSSSSLIITSKKMLSEIFITFSVSFTLMINKYLESSFAKS